MITDPIGLAQAVTAVAAAAAAAGDHTRAGTVADQAEALAQSITGPTWQAQALADLAKEVEPGRARTLLARAIRLDGW